jgi:Bacterial Ig-like domain (group 1)
MFQAMREALPRLRVGVLVALLVLGACTLNTDVSLGPAGLIKVPDGEGQTAAPNTTLPIPLSVIVVNQFGDRLAGSTVNWSILTGGGTLSSSATLTDPTGTASVDYTTGATPGQVVIQASAAAGVLIITFNVTVS